MSLMQYLVKKEDIDKAEEILKLLLKPRFAMEISKILNPKDRGVLQTLERRGLVISTYVHVGRVKRRYYYLSETGYEKLLEKGVVNKPYETYQRKLMREHGLFEAMARETYGMMIKTEKKVGSRIPDLIHTVLDENNRPRIIHVEYERTNRFSVLLKHIIESLPIADAVLILVDNMKRIEEIKNNILSIASTLKRFSGVIAIMLVDDYLKGKIRTWKDLLNNQVLSLTGSQEPFIPTSLRITKRGNKKIAIVTGIYEHSKDNMAYEYELSFIIHNQKPIGKIICGVKTCSKKVLDFSLPEKIENYPHIKHLVRFIIEHLDSPAIPQDLKEAIVAIFDNLFPNAMKYNYYDGISQNPARVRIINIGGKELKVCLTCRSNKCEHTRVPF